MYGQECNYEEICQKIDMMMNNDTFYKEMTQKAYDEYMNNYCLLYTSMTWCEKLRWYKMDPRLIS